MGLTVAALGTVLVLGMHLVACVERPVPASRATGRGAAEAYAMAMIAGNAASASALVGAPVEGSDLARQRRVLFGSIEPTVAVSVALGSFGVGTEGGEDYAVDGFRSAAGTTTALHAAQASFVFITVGRDDFGAWRVIAVTDGFGSDLLE